MLKCSIGQQRNPSRCQCHIKQELIQWTAESTVIEWTWKLQKIRDDDKIYWHTQHLCNQEWSSTTSTWKGDGVPNTFAVGSKNEDIIETVHLLVSAVEQRFQAFGLGFTDGGSGAIDPCNRPRRQSLNTRFITQHGLGKQRELPLFAQKERKKNKKKKEELSFWNHNNNTNNINNNERWIPLSAMKHVIRGRRWEHAPRCQTYNACHGTRQREWHHSSCKDV